MLDTNVSALEGVLNWRFRLFGLETSFGLADGARRKSMNFKNEIILKIF